MKVGSIVEFIGEMPIPPVSIQTHIRYSQAIPQPNTPYTVRTLEEDRGVWIRLEEIVNPIMPSGVENSYNIDYFRELLPPADISEIYKDALTIPERGLILVKETINTPTYET